MIQYYSTKTHTKLINETITRFRKDHQKTLQEELKYDNRKHQNPTCYQKYEKQEILDAQLSVN